MTDILILIKKWGASQHFCVDQLAYTGLSEMQEINLNQQLQCNYISYLVLKNSLNFWTIYVNTYKS